MSFLDFSWARSFWVWGLIGFLGLVSAGVFAFYPLYQEENRLQAEKAAWQAVQPDHFDPSELSSSSLIAGIPSLEQLPALMEACQAVFHEEGIEVSSLNVERIASDTGGSVAQGGPSALGGTTMQGGTSAQSGTAVQGGTPGVLLNFALVRLHWKGTWAGIERGLVSLENNEKFRVRVQEVSLKQGGGEGTLEIYFRSPVP